MTGSQNDGSTRLREGRVDPMKRKPLVRGMERHTAAIFAPRRSSEPAGIGALFRALFKKLHKPVVRTSEQEIEHGLDMVRLKSPTQLAGALARALLAKKTLETTRQVELPFPTAVLAGTTLDASQRDELLRFAAQMKVFRAKCENADTPLTLAVFGGLDLWIAVFESAGNDRMEAALEIWSALEQGRDQVVGALAFMLRRDITDVEKEYLDYVPVLLKR